ncbi:ribonuclease Y [Sanguibacter sp. 25GB23B1]|uniref:ribonuclease Y n=1 Tax=unclassified Sanguibacter TaxID=2645534 RepID=UPI0032AF229B
MTIQDLGILLALLGASLVALLLVQVARREASAVREQAAEDVAELRAEVKRREAESRQRLEEARETERDVADQRRRAEAATERAEALVLDTEKQQRESSDEIRRLRAQMLAQLESTAGLSREDACARLVDELRDQAVHDASTRVRRIEATARQHADERARRIVATSVQRLAVATSSQIAVVALPLPSEEMRGRIIGKEGRNIRTFEAVTGVNVILEDDSGSVQLSSFDPERRALAEVTMRLLIEDGRIQPQRIEAAYAEAVAGAASRTVSAGHDAAVEAGVQRLSPELIESMGRLRLRTSYAQNVLRHSVETALVAAAMAAEIGADVDIARRAGFLHDIGKGFTGAASGSHATLGALLAERSGESSVVVNAIAAHHGEVDAQSVEAVLVQAADASSAARPGARRDDLDRYVERMERLEALVAGHPGVRRVLAMASGHEVRVVVEPSEVDDAELDGLATAIAAHIERDLDYPGEIAITVVRELRATATAG